MEAHQLNYRDILQINEDIFESNVVSCMVYAVTPSKVALEEVFLSKEAKLVFIEMISPPPYTDSSLLLARIISNGIRDDYKARYCAIAFANVELVNLPIERKGRFDLDE